MKNPLASITMESGKCITIELFPEIAPNTVNNFIALANSGFYDGLVFHRVIPGFMIQGGCPEGSGLGGPGYSIKGEFAKNGFDNELKHERGVISMARSVLPDSAGSQFFITTGKHPHLDGEYAAFGSVKDGMEEAEAISRVRRDHEDRPLQEQKIKTLRIDTFEADYPEPEKIN